MPEDRFHSLIMSKKKRAITTDSHIESMNLDLGLKKGMPDTTTSKNVVLDSSQFYNDSFATK